MPQYVIERTVPGVGGMSGDELKALSQKSVGVLADLGPEIVWEHSYVADDKIYCVYTAPSPDLVLEHARCGGFPAEVVAEVKAVISPATAEG